MPSRPPLPFLPVARLCIAACVMALASVLVMSAPADGAMRSKQISKNLCKTRGGGKFVKVPKHRGTKVDKRILKDVRWMARKFNLGLGDGYAMSGHAMNGEHPIGLALDIYAGNGRNSGWNKVDKLAKLAEPKQNQPRLPWRWVGYDGDSGHGRGHHLHLSWGHNDGTTPGKPAKWVLTRSCPGKGGGDSSSDTSDSGGGISSRRSPALKNLAPAVPEPHEHHLSYKNVF